MIFHYFFIVRKIFFWTSKALILFNRELLKVQTDSSVFHKVRKLLRKRKLFEYFGKKIILKYIHKNKPKNLRITKIQHRQVHLHHLDAAAEELRGCDWRRCRWLGILEDLEIVNKKLRITMANNKNDISFIKFCFQNWTIKISYKLRGNTKIGG